MVRLLPGCVVGEGEEDNNESIAFSSGDRACVVALDNCGPNQGEKCIEDTR